jgi:hypothetical protein
MSVESSDRSYPNRGLHGKVVHEIGLRIVSGQLEPGSALPTEGELGHGPAGRGAANRAGPRRDR